MEEIVNSWNVQLEQDATTFTNEAVKVRAGQPKHSTRQAFDAIGCRPPLPMLCCVCRGPLPFFGLGHSTSRDAHLQFGVAVCL